VNYTTSAHDPVLGAGVAWQVRDEQGSWAWASKSFVLGLKTGSVMDTELFGIRAALGLAVERIGTLEAVKVFSDSVNVLDLIGRGEIWALGPAVSLPWTLEDVYNHAAVLTKEVARGGTDTVEEWLWRKNKFWIMEGKKPRDDAQARGDDEGEAASDEFAEMDISSKEE
jgi:hypothetical protein